MLEVQGLTVANALYAKPQFTTASGNTLVINQQVATARTGAPGDKLDAGIVSFDDTAFSVDADGYVTLSGGSGPAVDTMTGDDSIAVSPDAAGNFNWNGITVANATHAKPAYFKDATAANTIDLDIQVGAAVTGAPGDKNDAGLVSFDDTAFAVDADGYVTLSGSGSAIEQFTLDDSNTVTPTAGNVDLFGQGTPNTTGLESFQIDGDSIGIRMASPFTLEDFTFSTDTAASTRTLTVENTDNTSTSSNAQISIDVGGASGGDPFLHFNVPSATEYSLGIDNTNGTDSLFLTDGATPSAGNSLMQIQPTIARATFGYPFDSNNNRIWCRNAGVVPTDNGATIVAGVVGASGDAWFTCEIEAARSYCFGIDNSDGDKLKINTDAASDVTPSSGTTLIEIDTSGNGIVTGSWTVDNLKLDGNVLSSIDTNGDINLTPDGTGDVIVSKADIGGTITAQISNTDNTNTSSHALLEIKTGGSSGGNPYTRYNIDSATTLSMGLTNTAAGDPFDITDGTSTTSGNLIARWDHVNQNYQFGYAENSNTNILVGRNTGTTLANAAVQASVGATSTGDAWLNVQIEAVRSYCFGIDNDDGDKLKINTLVGSEVSPSSGTSLWEMTTAGERTMPLQPAFLAYLGTSDLNVTGNGTVFALGDTDVGTALTEVKDNNSDFSTGSSAGATFTAPVDGFYVLGCNIGFLQGTTATDARADIFTSNQAFQGPRRALGALSEANISNEVVAYMDASDVARFRAIASGVGADTTDVQGVQSITYVYGYLLG